MEKVTDPGILKQLESSSGEKVTDPALLAQLEAPPEKSIGGFISNVGKNAVEVGKGLVNVAIHPIDTVRNIETLASGVKSAGLEKLGIGEADPGQRQMFETVTKPITESIKNPSGIPGRMLDYAYEKPVDTAMWASGGLKLAGMTAKVGGLARTAKVLETAAKVTDPLTIPLKVAKPVVGAVKKGAREIVGSLTGAGPGMVEVAPTVSKAFEKTMRGKITGEEVVQHAKDALHDLYSQKTSEYQQKLANLPNPYVDPSPVQIKLRDLMKKYNVVVTPTGELDLSRVKMGKAGKHDIEEMVNRVWDHGNKPGDKTALGMDGLKRELDDFYSESSQARAFVTDLRNTTKNTIVKAVPEYENMMKGYSDWSTLIKDIESNLMLRKQGMTGRITADNTLRRLSSALRENFEMRKDLLKTLGTKSGMDIIGEVAGYGARKWIPWGLQGKTLTMGGGYFLKAFNPQFWPILLTSSPRVTGEFLNAWGKAAKAVGPSLSAVANVARQPAVLAPLGLAGRTRRYIDIHGPRIEGKVETPGTQPEKARRPITVFEE